jgi:hypothetical protein
LKAGTYNTGEVEAYEAASASRRTRTFWNNNSTSIVDSVLSAFSSIVFYFIIVHFSHSFQHCYFLRLEGGISIGYFAAAAFFFATPVRS